MSRAQKLISLLEKKLIGSAGSLEDIQKAISKWYYSDVTLKQVNDKEWEVHNSKGLIDGVKVTLKKGRYRFEME